ncbi:MAG: extracellular solute-binding protein [Corallococcus sp.]|nr:extracellular solute-binding protein [Corallococcus sp.]
MQKRRIICAAAVALFAVCCVFSFTACNPSEEADNLVVYNCADYIYDFEDDFAEYYAEQTGGRKINVTYVTYDTNETMLTKILKSDSNVDLICPSEYAIQKLLEAEVLEPINYFNGGKIDQDTDFKNNGRVNGDIVEKVKQSFDGFTVNGNAVDLTDYFVPYMYGTLGILYNVDVMEENGITAEMLLDAGWGILFNKDKQGNKLSAALDNRIFMKDSIRDSYAATLFYLKCANLLDEAHSQMSVGELINCVDQYTLSTVKDALVEQKKVLYGYEVDFGKNDLVAGNAYVDLAWSGDAMFAIEEAKAYGVTLGYIAPEEAGNIWFDGWVMPKSAQNKRAAKIFIDFLNSPYVAAQNMVEIGYSSAVDKDEIKGNSDAMSVLCEAYNVNAPEYFQAEEAEHKYDYTLEKFTEYFFSDIRYPDVTDERLGVMHDFGSQNNNVVMMWETVRSTGITAWALLGWTVLALAVAAGVIAIIYAAKAHGRKYVVLDGSKK